VRLFSVAFDMQHQGPTFDQPWYKCTLVHCDWIHEHWPCSPPFFPNHLWSVCTAVRQLTNPSIHQFVGLMIRLCTNVFFEMFLDSEHFPWCKDAWGIHLFHNGFKHAMQLKVECPLTWINCNATVLVTEINTCRSATILFTPPQFKL
jgi:hypothetical protein